jgi:hypothetical protein
MPVDNLTSRDSNSPVDNSDDNREAVYPEAENLAMNIYSQQHPVARANCSKEKKRRGERRPTLGHGLESILARTGSTMKVGFMEGANMPINPASSKTSSEVGFEIKNHLPLKTKWKEYNAEGNKHMLPKT